MWHRTAASWAERCCLSKLMQLRSVYSVYSGHCTVGCLQSSDFQATSCAVCGQVGDSLKHAELLAYTQHPDSLEQHKPCVLTLDQGCSQAMCSTLHSGWYYANCDRYITGAGP